MLASFQTDSHGPRTHIIHHHGASFIDGIGHFADPDRAHDGIPVQLCKGRITRAGELPPDQGRTVLQVSQASGVEPARQLVHRPDSCQDFHCRLDSSADDGSYFCRLINRLKDRSAARLQLHAPLLVRCCGPGRAPASRGSLGGVLPQTRDGRAGRCTNWCDCWHGFSP